MSLGFPGRPEDTKEKLRNTPAQIMAALDQALENRGWEYQTPGQSDYPYEKAVHFVNGDQYFQVQSLADGLGGVRNYRIVYGEHDPVNSTYSVDRSFQWSHNPRETSYVTLTDLGTIGDEINPILNALMSALGH